MSKLKAVAEIVVAVAADVWAELKAADYAVLAVAFCAGAAAATLLVWIL